MTNRDGLVLTLLALMAIQALAMMGVLAGAWAGSWPVVILCTLVEMAAVVVSLVVVHKLGVSP